jgi:hypothetical protein
MPRLNVATHTVHAICRHFAHKPDFDLDCSHLALAVQSKLPGAEIIHGTAACTGESPEPCSWIRAGGRDYDVQRIAQQRRFGVAFALTLDLPMLGDRLLQPSEDQTHEFPDTPRGHTVDLEGWSLPSCAACCGKCRAHTLDSNCVSPWKAETLRLRGVRSRQLPCEWTPFTEKP